MITIKEEDIKFHISKGRPKHKKVKATYEIYRGGFLSEFSLKIFAYGETGGEAMELLLEQVKAVNKL
jgi:hypothetical protein